MQRPAGIAEDLASHDDDIGLPGAQDVIGLLGRADEAHCARCYARLPADPFGKLRLVAGADRHLCAVHISARGTIHQVNTEGLQGFCELDGLLDIPSAFSPIGR